MVAYKTLFNPYAHSRSLVSPSKVTMLNAATAQANPLSRIAALFTSMTY
jgi:hypothetical protein